MEQHVSKILSLKRPGKKREVIKSRAVTGMYISNLDDLQINWISPVITHLRPNFNLLPAIKNTPARYSG